MITVEEMMMVVMVIEEEKEVDEETSDIMVVTTVTVTHTDTTAVQPVTSLAPALVLHLVGTSSVADQGHPFDHLALNGSNQSRGQ